ncbi:MAG: subtilisin-like proprotein convertase family protein [Saprospiraceae bacterium]|jgi:subtilisin-like proprotein convertase family protein
MKKKIFTLLFALSVLSIEAQDDRIARTNMPLSEVAQLVMPTLDNKALLEAEMAARAPGRAPHFAETMEVFVTPDTHGNWEELENGNMVWRLRILSTDAKSLNLGFTKYFMPAGGTLVLYSIDMERVMGPFTPSDNEEHEQLWTPVLNGDHLVVEVQVPTAAKNDLQLELKSVNHDYLGFGSPSALLSGSCNLDVICTEADGYRDIIQSVAVIGQNGGTFCTGFLVNSVREDCAPLFMTANHCGINNAGAAATLVAYWNFQNSTCREPGSGASGGNGDGSLADFNTGATHLASYAPSDVTIVQFDDPISETANAFYAGWDATDAIPTSAIGIHHPSTDEKRISFENDPLLEGIGLSNNTSNDGDHLIIPDWDIGTTESGSSGSPVFNADKRIVGQLHGGGAACGNDAYDTYGWFFTSWEGGGTPSTRLKDWLDPDNTGTLIIDGRGEMQCNFFVDATPAIQDLCQPTELVYEIEVSATFETEVTLDITNLPAGTTATFSVNPVAPGGVSTLTVTGLTGIASGSYTMNLSGTDGTEMTTSDLVINVTDAAPGSATLNTPANTAMDVVPAPSFVWTIADVTSHEMQLATDAAFTAIAANPMGLNTAEYSTSGLEALTTYYWRVRSTNICGTGDWSETYSFTTGNCSFNVSADIPVTIPSDGTPAVFSTLNIPFIGVIYDLNVVDVIGSHSYLSDLIFTLTSPSGTSVILISEQCGSQDDFNITFDDSATGNPPCPYDDGGTYAPTGNLADFNDENPQGDWILEVEDGADADGGALENWGLQICASGVVNISASVSPSNADLCTADTESFEVTIAGDFEGDVTVTAVSSPAGLPVDIANPTTTSGGSVTATLGSLVAVDAGTYTITFTASDGTNSITTTAEVTVAAPPAVANLTVPADGASGVALMPSFNWGNIANADDYTIEIATDADFNNIINTVDLTTNTYNQASALLYETVYFWRISAENDCGGSLSSINNFTTEMMSGLNDLDGIAVQISPNPTNGLVNVQFGQALTGNVTLEVYGLNGQLMQTSQARNGAANAILNLRDYADGVYLVKLKTDNDVLVRRIAVQN